MQNLIYTFKQNMPFLVPISTQPTISHLPSLEIICTELYPYWTKNEETKAEILITPLSTRVV